MELKETAQLLMSIKTSYKRWFDGSKEEFSQMVETWYEALKDEPYEMAKGALVTFSRNSQYPPTIADIYRPYKEYLEQQKVLRREYNEVYLSAIAFYPCYQDSREERIEFDRITENSVTKARILARQIEAFVREKETGRGEMPTLINYLKGLKKIE